MLRSLIGVAVVQGNELFSSIRMPDLPANAQYLLHENCCFDWGAAGWAVAEGKVAPTRYSHIILVNSSVRGPFLPAYWPVRHAARPMCMVLAHAPEHAVPLRLVPRRNAHLLQCVTGRWPGLLGSMAACRCCLFAARRARSRCATPGLAARYPQAGVHWSAVLTTRLNDMVKLVGPTISCEPAYLASDFAKERHQNAHVQSYVIATDQARAERPAVSLRSRSMAPADLANSHHAQLSRDALPRRLALVCCSATCAFLNATRTWRTPCSTRRWAPRGRSWRPTTPSTRSCCATRALTGRTKQTGTAMPGTPLAARVHSDMRAMLFAPYQSMRQRRVRPGSTSVSAQAEPLWERCV